MLFRALVFFFSSLSSTHSIMHYIWISIITIKCGNHNFCLFTIHYPLVQPLAIVPVPEIPYGKSFHAEEHGVVLMSAISDFYARQQPLQMCNTGGCCGYNPGNIVAWVIGWTLVAIICCMSRTLLWQQLGPRFCRGYCLAC